MPKNSSVKLETKAEKKPKLEVKPKNAKLELKRLKLNYIEKRINQDYRVMRENYGDIIRYVILLCIYFFVQNVRK